VILPVFFVGAFALHLLVEMQNRYHYYLLTNFALLAALGLGFLYQEYLQRIKVKRPELEYAFEAIPAAAALEADQDNSDDDISESNAFGPAQKEQILPQIDVLKAIEEGHIIITATEAYRDINGSDSLTGKENVTGDLEKDTISVTSSQKETEQGLASLSSSTPPEQSQEIKTAQTQAPQSVQPKRNQNLQHKINRSVQPQIAGSDAKIAGKNHIKAESIVPTEKRSGLKKKTTLASLVKRRISYNKKRSKTKKQF
jgi:hypothetical protein